MTPEPDFPAMFARMPDYPVPDGPFRAMLRCIRLRHVGGAFLMLAFVWAVYVLPEAIVRTAADYVAEDMP